MTGVDAKRVTPIPLPAQTASPPAPPTQLQACLLRAVTTPGPIAIDAWHDWRSAVTVDQLDTDSQWLLPLLFHQLHAAGVDPSLLQRYSNVYRHNWLAATARLHAVAIIIAELDASGHASTFAEGAVLSAYPTVACRPFHQALLLVDSPEAAAHLADIAARQIKPALGLRVRALHQHDDRHRSTASSAVTLIGRRFLAPTAPMALARLLVDPIERDPSHLLWAVDAVMLARRLDDCGWQTLWHHVAALDATDVAMGRLACLQATGLTIDVGGAA